MKSSKDLSNGENFNNKSNLNFELDSNFDLDLKLSQEELVEVDNDNEDEDVDENLNNDNYISFNIYMTNNSQIIQGERIKKLPSNTDYKKTNQSQYSDFDFCNTQKKENHIEIEKEKELPIQENIRNNDINVNDYIEFQENEPNLINKNNYNNHNHNLK